MRTVGAKYGGYLALMLAVVVLALLVTRPAGASTDPPLPVARPALRDVVDAHTRRLDALAVKVDKLERSLRLERTYADGIARDLTDLNDWVADCLTEATPMIVDPDVGAYAPVDASNPLATFVIVTTRACAES